MLSDQQTDELFICRWKSERRQLGPFHPPHLLAQQRPRRLLQHALIEKECDRSFGVDVCRVEDEILHVDVRVELLAHLATQCIGVAFGRIDLAAGKLPQPREVHTLRASRDQKRVVLLDDSGDDNDGGRGDGRSSGLSPRSVKR